MISLKATLEAIKTKLSAHDAIPIVKIEKHRESLYGNTNEYNHYATIPNGATSYTIVYNGCYPESTWNTYYILHYISDNKINLKRMGSGSQNYILFYTIIYTI